MNGPVTVGTFIASNEVPCPHCGAPLDWHSRRGDVVRPKPKDRTLCFRCGGISVFVDSPLGLGLVLRKATDKEIGALRADEHVRRLRAARMESYTPQEALLLADEIPLKRKRPGPTH